MKSNHAAVTLIKQFARVQKLKPLSELSSVFVGSLASGHRCYCTRDTYYNVYNECLKNPAEFWEREAFKLTWTKPWHKVLDDTDAPYTKW